MQIGSKVVCAYAGRFKDTGHLRTGGEYKLLSIFDDHGTAYCSIIDESGAERTYEKSRFIAIEDVGATHD